MLLSEVEMINALIIASIAGMMVATLNIACAISPQILAEIIGMVM